VSASASSLSLSLSLSVCVCARARVCVCVCTWVCACASACVSARVLLSSPKFYKLPFRGGIFTNIQDGGVIFQALPRKSTTHLLGVVGLLANVVAFAWILLI
jgi:hypothetical protein